MKLVVRYNAWLRSNPVSSRLVTSFIISLNGDFLCQYIESKIDNKNFRESFTAKRSLNLAVFASSVITPIFYFWYNYLAKIFPGTNFKSVISKVILDRSVAAPPVLFSFFTSQTLMNGGTWEDAKSRLEKNYFRALKMGSLVWPLALLINFRFIPLENQVLFVNSVGFFWSIYLSYTIHKNKITELEFLHQTD